jgi:hypothetical protein
MFLMSRAHLRDDAILLHQPKLLLCAEVVEAIDGECAIRDVAVTAMHGNWWPSETSYGINPST